MEWVMCKSLFRKLIHADLFLYAKSHHPPQNHVEFTTFVNLAKNFFNDEIQHLRKTFKWNGKMPQLLAESSLKDRRLT
jgi:hypothetical protein